MRRFLASCAVVGLAVGATAQLPSVVPNRYAAVEGGGTSEAPADWAPIHMQAVYHRAGITSGTATFQGIRFRRDGNPNNYFSHTESVQVELSSQGVPDTEYSHTVYATNRGTDHKVVFAGSINFPNQAGGPGPLPFGITVPFNARFAYAAGNNLLVEIVVLGTNFSQFGYLADATPGLVQSPAGTSQDVGVGCPTSNALAVQGNVPWPGAPFILRAATGGAQGLAGFTAFGSQNLFIKLDPFGAPSCTLYQDIAVQIPGTVGGGGIFTADLGRLPRNPGLAGGQVRVQQFVLDPSYNAFGLRSSQSVLLTIGNGFNQGLEAHAWYDRRPNTTTLFTQADFRSTGTPIVQLY